MNFNIRNEINGHTASIGFFGALIYFLLLIFPVLPGGPSTIFASLVLISMITAYLIFELGEDRVDYSNLVLLPLAAFLTAILYIKGSDATISIARHLGIHFGPLTLGILIGYIIRKIVKSDKISFKIEDEDK